MFSLIVFELSVGRMTESKHRRVKILKGIEFDFDIVLPVNSNVGPLWRRRGLWNFMKWIVDVVP